MFDFAEHAEILNAAASGLGSLDVRLDILADDLVRVSVGSDTQTYDVDVRTGVSPASAATLDKSDRWPTLLVADHIGERTAKVLRARGIEYVDGSGNSYLRIAGSRIDVRGRVRTSTDHGTEPGGSVARAFSNSGTKVIFVLLAWPSLAEAPLRAIAEAAKVSLGSAQSAVSSLQESGYLTDPSQGRRRLRRTRSLMDRWVEAYTTRLRVKTALRTFYSDSPMWWLDSQDEFERSDAILGGEAAAHVTDGYLRPMTCTIYSPQLPTAIIGNHRLIPTGGQFAVYFRQRFWSDPSRERHSPPTGRGGPNVTPSILTYADLISTEDPRQIEAAEHLRRFDVRLLELDER
jgi:hypothetical protein